MSIDNFIQLGILVVLALTLIPIRKTFSVQLLRDRYQMFFSAWDVTDEDVRQFQAKDYLFIEHVDRSEIERRFKGNDEAKNEEAIRNYLLIVQLSEYLAFAHTFNTNSNYLGSSLIGKCWDSSTIGKCWHSFRQAEPADPYGEQWVERLVTILIKERDDDFQLVRKAYRDDHPEFFDFVDKIEERLKRKIQQILP